MRRMVMGWLMLSNLVGEQLAVAAPRDPFANQQLNMETQFAKDIRQQPLASFLLLGILNNQHQALAMVKDANNHTYALKVGDVIGIENAVVTQINAKNILLQWRVQNQLLQQYLALES